MASHVPDRLQIRGARNKREHWKFLDDNRMPLTLATMARADRSARADIMASWASSRKSLFRAWRNAYAFDFAPAHCRRGDEKNRCERSLSFVFLTARVGCRRRRGTTHVDIVGSHRRLVWLSDCSRFSCDRIDVFFTTRGKHVSLARDAKPLEEIGPSH
jgi:hypothetical protein